MISIAITTHNRSGFTVESFINVLDHPNIGEIVIIDDCSDPLIFNNLKSIIMRLNHVKIRLIRNKRNIGSFLNRIVSVRRCKHDWVIALDSDNVIDNDYVDIVSKIALEEDTMYCPQTLYDVSRKTAQWDYAEYVGTVIDKNNVVKYVDEVNFEIHLNTGNAFFHKQQFLNAMSMATIPSQSVVGGDSTYMYYLWLLSGNRTQIVGGLGYGHRVHSDSLYMQNVNKGLEFNAKVYQMIREFNPPIGGFVVSKDFKNMMKRSYDFNQTVFDTDPRWATLADLYTKNFFETTRRDPRVIPKKIHQIWLGGEMPDKYKQYADTWKALHPEWEYKLWTDADVSTMNIPNKALFDSLSNYGPKSDIMRYHVLNEYGGVYADTDFECLRSFDAFMFLEFFTGVGYPSKVELYPGLIGCIPHHPILEQIIKSVKEMKSIPNTPTGVLESISSYFFTREFWKVVTGYTENIVAFPPDYFYPFPNQKGHHKRDGRVYVKDCSYALHHWAVSWLK